MVIIYYTQYEFMLFTIRDKELLTLPKPGLFGKLYENFGMTLDLTVAPRLDIGSHIR